MRFITLTIALAGAAFAAPVFAQTQISGPSRVIDGDTVVVSGVHVRLKGVDAAERGTVMGDLATEAMVRIVGNQNLTCQLTGEKTYHRDVGYCVTEDGVDIAEAIIKLGAALSCPRYSVKYLQFEQPATLSLQNRARYCHTRGR